MEGTKLYADMSPEEQVAYVASLELSVAEAAKEISKLSAALGNAEKAGAKNPIVIVNNEKYEFTIKRFKFEGVEHTAESASKDEELCAKLIEMEFGGLVKK